MKRSLVITQGYGTDDFFAYLSDATSIEAAQEAQNALPMDNPKDKAPRVRAVIPLDSTDQRMCAVAEVIEMALELDAGGQSSGTRDFVLGIFFAGRDLPLWL